MSRASSRITLVVHAETATTTAAAFPVDEPPTERGTSAATAARDRVPRAGELRHAPDRACVATCAALGLDALPDPGLRGWDAGRWAGQTLDEVAAEEPDALRDWLTRPDAAPHGGESLESLIERVGAWLSARRAGHTLAICGPAVARAAVVHAIGAPASGFWRVDAAPLTGTDLRGGSGRWTVRATGRPLLP
ncbi:histidine phosphatase family protein [Pseudonocardia parietis]|uniref:Broad specificity phosphatase PhoE n=1 Tax=Pseudonocardia parietis TaxID=570936 RepID=A0ABS4VNK4_9PSEU|nr:histidine phosphatase family protein [Pseudonocardia parietis]MBP2365510.1 broad specificity phosphatase PhoE [Pseudonocardia parietis]